MFKEQSIDRLLRSKNECYIIGDRPCQAPRKGRGAQTSILFDQYSHELHTKQWERYRERRCIVRSWKYEWYVFPKIIQILP